jgi:hypothetical protein
MVKTDEFGYGTGKIKYKDQATRFKGKVGRQDDPLEPDFVAQDYPDTQVCRSHHGDMRIKCYIPGKDYTEDWDATGNHKITYEDGSVAEGFTGTRVKKNTQGEIGTTQYSSDSATYNHSRSVIGNDGNQKGLQQGGGTYSETYGNRMTYTSGMEGKVSGGSAVGGFHGSHYATNVDVGLGGIGGKNGGIGQGVSNKGTLLSTVRHKHDGEVIHQIMPPPNSETAGVVTVRYKPDGTIIITTDSTHTTTNGGQHTIKAPMIYLDGPVHITGPVTTDSTIKSKGAHTAPQFHGVADVSIVDSGEV